MLTFVGICHTSCLPNFGRQMVNCPSIRHIVPAKIFPALSLCQKNWFCSKVCCEDFYPLLRSIASSWIHIAVKRISQVCCLDHLKNMEKDCKTQLWDEKQNRALFLDCILKSTKMMIPHHTPSIHHTNKLLLPTFGTAKERCIYKNVRNERETMENQGLIQSDFEHSGFKKG